MDKQVKGEDENKMEVKLYSTVLPVQPHRHSCHNKVYSTLVKVRTRREMCSTQQECSKLERHIKRFIRGCKKLAMIDVVAVLTYELCSIPSSSSDTNNMIASLVKCFHGSIVNQQLQDIGMASMWMAKAADTGDFGLLVSVFLTLLTRMQGCREGYELSLIYYKLGSCLLTILRKTDSDNYDRIADCITQLHIEYPSSYKHCIRAIREAAVRSFALARDALVSDSSSQRSCPTNRYHTVAYFYDAQSEHIYPLLGQVNALLDVPEWHNGQKRCFVTVKDLNQAEKILRQVEREYQHCGITSKRLQGRLLLNWAAFYFRQTQLLLEAMKKDFEEFGQLSTSSLQRAGEVLAQKHNALERIESSYYLLRGTILQEKERTKVFVEFLKKFYRNTGQFVEMACKLSNIRNVTVTTQSSSDEINTEGDEFY